MSVGKLHELLAVEGDLGATAKKLIEEAVVTLGKKTDHFMGQVVRIEMLDEERTNENRTDSHEMVTTVADKLNYLISPISRHIDAVLQKDLTNQLATADLVVDGTTLIEAVPATFLLGLEKYLQRLRQVYEEIPTLKPGLKWEKDEMLGSNIYSSPEQVSFRTEKVPIHKIIVEPTEHHPAQIDKWTEDRNVGKVIKTETSSTLSPLDKSLILGRIDTLSRAVKKARQRANYMEIVDHKIGKVLFTYIHGSEIAGT